ncbi:MAG TPA: ATP-binding protein [Pirellulales bacterium]
MSLWHQTLDQVTFEDIEAFCKLGLPEGPRLDYKSAMPAELQKLVASFANTLGGLILLGVGTDSHNHPIWPAAGMPADRGISERIVQICRDAIYPPVLPEISPIIPNNGQHGTVLAVVRVRESPDAPHAIANSTRVYIRTGDVNHKFELADLPRLGHLLGRRKRLESDRDALVERALIRARRFVQNDGLRPAVWASVIPIFPWRELCTEPQCAAIHFVAGYDETVAAPGGCISLRSARGPQAPLGFSCADSKGMIFAYQSLFEDEPSLYDCTHLAHRTYEAARRFFSDARVEKPGWLRCSIGLENVARLRLALHKGGGRRFGCEFPDAEFFAFHDCPYEQLADEQFFENKTHSIELPLFRTLAHGLGLPLPPSA